MQIELFLENKRMELNENISIPLNKSFENLEKPTDIFVDYTKSIAIPATCYNNKILGNAYRLDKQFTDGKSGLGLEMNPLKRIPAKLLYNGEILFDGYAKYVSSSQIENQIYYNMNLYGAVGDVFQTLMSVVTNADKLTEEQKAEDDGGMKYLLIGDFFRYDGILSTLIRDWEKEHPYNWNNKITDGLLWTDELIGFAPAYRGLYDDFESNYILGLDWNEDTDGIHTHEPETIEDALKRIWKRKLKQEHSLSEEDAEERVNAIDIAALVGEGLNEHSMRQFRVYEQKPYLYFTSLLELFRQKCSELTNYRLELDPEWFNVNNPYYTRMCYMLDYLSNSGVTKEESTLIIPEYKSTYDDSLSVETKNLIEFSYSDEGRTLHTKPFNIVLENTLDANSVDPLWSNKGGINDSIVTLADDTYVTVDICCTNRWSDEIYKEYKYYAANNVDNVTQPIGYQNFIQTTNITKINKVNKTLTGYSYITIPSVELNIPPDYPSIDFSLYFSVKVTIHNSNGRHLLYRYRNPLKGSTKYEHYGVKSTNSDYQIVIPDVYYYSNWRKNTDASLKNIYTKDEPIFKVILEYTKMFGLIWKADYHNKTVTITTRQSYFKDYEIIDWTDKFDGTKECLIEPVSFSSKYVSFDYENVDGYKYTGYKNKYGVNYGGKTIKTKYEFNNETKKMFEGIQPSSVSTRSFIPIATLAKWNTYDIITPEKSPVSFIDCDNAEQNSAISLNNWYLRGDNISVPENTYYVSEVSDEEIKNEKYFWLANDYEYKGGYVINITSLPSFSVAFDTSNPYSQNRRTVGCLMNCPSEDFTDDKIVSRAVDNYIYDICWRDYINERYNSNNKKVTAYFKLSYKDFTSFNFNRLILFNNQLFVVNRIYDFEPNVIQSTKVELIQIHNLNAYTDTGKLFPQILANKSILYGNAGDGTISVTISTSEKPTYKIIDDEGYSIGIDEVQFEQEGPGVYTLSISYVNAPSGYRGIVRFTHYDYYTYDIPIEIN